MMEWWRIRIDLYIISPLNVLPGEGGQLTVGFLEPG
jgi:hypothetical protein